jgi:hypothetical protein
VACWLTQAARDLIQDLDDVRVVALRRNKEETVESLVECFGAQRIRAEKPFGPMCFPTYDDYPMEEGWAQYWEDYMEVVSDLEDEHPGRVLTVDLSVLEAEETQERIARHVGVDEWHHVEPCHKGKREDR